MRSLLVLSVLGLFGLISAGCQSQLHDENMKLHRQTREQQAVIDDLRSRPAPAADQTQVRALQDQIAQRDAELARLRNAATTTPAPSTTGLEGMDTSYDPRAGTLTVNVPGDLLFESGKATLKDSARATLDRIVAVLNNQYAGKPVRVEGHTDADPIIRTRDQWQDNLDLSLERAATVTRYLQQAKVDPRRITTSGLGEYHPKANKAASRRVEIVVVTR